MLAAFGGDKLLRELRKPSQPSAVNPESCTAVCSLGFGLEYHTLTLFFLKEPL